MCEKNGAVLIRSSDGDINYWRNYFDLQTDYSKSEDIMKKHEHLRKAAKFGKGIRILRQDKWEALCSFIISQCNNIPRIKGIVERLSEAFGDKLFFEGEEHFSFPTAERLSLLKADDLAPIRAGYRAEYIIAAAKAVADGSLNLEETAKLPAKEAKEVLLSLTGVGSKVADCAMLYGLHKTEAFPIDVWMKRALKEHFSEGFDPEALGEFAGLAQQYIFFLARSTGNDKQ